MQDRKDNWTLPILRPLYSLYSTVHTKHTFLQNLLFKFAAHCRSHEVLIKSEKSYIPNWKCFES